MYTIVNFGKEMAILGAAWIWTIGVILWHDSETIHCNGNGCSGRW